MFYLGQTRAEASIDPGEQIMSDNQMKMALESKMYISINYYKPGEIICGHRGVEHIDNSERGTSIIICFIKSL